MNHFITVQEAKQIIASEVVPTVPVRSSLLDAVGFYAAESILAPMDVPSFSNSAMDGYGFHFADLKNGNELLVTHEIPAGLANAKLEIKEGEAVRIFTGSKIPNGVDTVVIQENVLRQGETISFDHSAVKKGDHIRLLGSQTEKGVEILAKNTFVNHAIIGFLAGFGIDRIRVFSPVKIGLLFTGDELTAVGEPLLDGKIYNTNSYMLRAALSEINHQLSLEQHVKDTEEETISSIAQAIDEVDVLLITGGISVGDYDYVKAALEKIGVEELFYKIKQKPGKPLFFGKLGKKYVFALPGNPASVFSCYHQYVKPFLLACAGRKNFDQDQDYAIAATAVQKKKIDLTQFLKAYYHQGRVWVLDGQESYKMDTAAQANCLLEFESGTHEIRIGEQVRLWKW